VWGGGDVVRWRKEITPCLGRCVPRFLSRLRFPFRTSCSDAFDALTLSGVDSVSGKDFSYRKEWIRQRIEKLASVFGVDVLTYAILSNHLHVVLRNRPDVVETWSDRQVALRWLQIFPGKRIDEQLGDPTTSDVDRLVNDGLRIATIRNACRISLGS
jgi:hypothetical protein